MDNKIYYAQEHYDGLFCDRCQRAMEKKKVTFSYMDNAFPVELPACPVCGFVYVPEELAVDKVLRVEKSLEDK